MESCQIFISYRRDGGADISGRIKDRLELLGYKVFYDITSMNSGTFDKQIIHAISSCADFLLILSPTALDRCDNENDWIRRELSLAIEMNKNIIPIIADGFEFPHNLPKEIDAVRLYEGVNVPSEYFDAAFDKMLQYLQSQIDDTKNKAYNITELVLENGGLYIGEVFENIPHGSGKCIYENGEKYEGEWSFGKYNGHGTYYYRNGDSYIGMFANGLRHGTGCLTRLDASYWNGTWQDDKCWTGDGTCYYSDGYYVGHLADAKRIGLGTMTWISAEQCLGTWTGEFKNDLPYNGIGKWLYDNGYYEGTWINGLRSGNGKYYWTSGDYKVGLWDNDKQNGSGTLYYKSGDSWKGVWKDDLFWEGAGLAYYSDGSFEGTWKDGKRTGYGIFMGYKHLSYRYDSIEGEWKDDKIWEGVVWGNDDGDIRKYTVKSGKWTEHSYNSYRQKWSDEDTGCYIATCVYGSYDCPEVWTLRRYRDCTLSRIWFGRLFIKAYYGISPFLVKTLGKYNWIRFIWKALLDPIVSTLNKQGVSNKPYMDS